VIRLEKEVEIFMKIVRFYKMRERNDHTVETPQGTKIGRKRFPVKALKIIG
jgi:hypothetical protein